MGKKRMRRRCRFVTQPFDVLVEGPKGEAVGQA